MKWIDDRRDVIQEALTVRRVLALPLIFGAATGVIGFIDFIGRHLSRGSVLFLGAPPWAWGTMASLVLLSYFFLEYSTRLHLTLKPKLKLSFDAQKAGLSFAIERVQVNAPGLSAALMAVTEFRTVYLRFRVEALSKRALRDCTASLVRLWLVDPEGRGLVEIELPHVVTLEPTQFDVLPHAPRMLDFLKARENQKMVPTMPWPYHMESVFDTHATYRFEFAVWDGEASERLFVEVHWTGVWNNIKANQIGSENG